MLRRPLERWRAHPSTLLQGPLHSLGTALLLRGCGASTGTSHATPSSWVPQPSRRPLTAHKRLGCVLESLRCLESFALSTVESVRPPPLYPTLFGWSTRCRKSTRTHIQQTV